MQSRRHIQDDKKGAALEKGVGVRRCAQTALVGLQGHPAMESPGMALYSVLREVKGRLGLDSVGICTGADILRRALDELARAEEEGAAAAGAGGGAAETGTGLAARVAPRAGVQVNDCGSPWWLSPGQHDSEGSLRERVGEFLAFARLCGRDRAVYVGHSLFFRAVCSAAGGAMERNRPGLVGPMRTAKLDNATALAVTVRFPDGDDGPPVVEDAAVLFGGGFTTLFPAG